jgi:hypothetical protein
MAVPGSTIQAVARIGVREDLSDRIAELFPDECPFQKAIGKENATQVYHEWQTDALTAANGSNKTIQGDDLANETRANTVRQGNYSQIMKKVVGASTTVEASLKAGRKSELAREIMKAGKELRTDAETRYCGNYAAVAPASGTAGETAGALCFLTTNSYLGVAGSPAQPAYSGGTTVGYPNTAAVNGTARTFTETLLKTALADVWTRGGSPDLVIMSVAKKQTAAAFGGLATQRRETGDKKITIVAGADVYVSDVGEVEFVPSRYCSTRDALIVDPEYWAIAELDPLKMIDLATTGLAKRKAMYQEVALVCRNEAASGVIRDLS